MNLTLNAETLGFRLNLTVTNFFFFLFEQLLVIRLIYELALVLQFLDLLVLLHLFFCYFELLLDNHRPDLVLFSKN